MKAMLEQPETRERAEEFSRATLAFLAKHNLPAEPRNYTLWYHLFSDRRPDLREILKAHVDGGEPLTQARCLDLYMEHFGIMGNGGALHHMAEKMSEEIGTLMGRIGEAGGDAAKYGEALSTFAGRLEGTDNVPKVESAIGHILSATQVMESRNRDLENKLSASATEISRLREDLEDMRREAMTDPLTGIANRKRFDEEMEQATRHSDDEGEALSLLIIDIDHFKKFNDNFGHQVGDQVLKLLASTIGEGIKGQDTAARFGGEEFCVILPRTDLGAAMAVAEHLRQRIGGKHLVNRATGENLGKITVSVGVAQYAGGEPVQDLVERADAALYRAKRAGRDRIESQDG